jgi:hypothetical protein
LEQVPDQSQSALFSQAQAGESIQIQVPLQEQKQGQRKQKLQQEHCWLKC